MTYEQLEDEVERVVDHAFSSVDRAELTKDDVISALEFAIKRIREGFYDNAA